MQGGGPGFKSQWVHVPDGSIPSPLSGTGHSNRHGRPMHHPVQTRMGRVDTRTLTTGRVDETVCTCDPGVHWTRFTEFNRRREFVTNSHNIRESPPGLTTTTWLLCHLVNGSARKPTKDVPSCDTLQGAARRQRTGDLRMGIPTAIASRNGERRELKHLSIGRKRKRNAMSSVTAGERDTAQTEGPTTDVV